MANKITESRLIPFNLQKGEGTPSHISPSGTMYFDVLSGITYQNIDGLGNWSALFGSTNQPQDIYVTGGTYDWSSGIATFRNNAGGSFTLFGFNVSSSGSGVFTGGTIVGGANFLAGLTSTTITSTSVSATTYYNLPTDIRVTGGTFSNGTTTFKNNTGGTFTVTGFTSNSDLSKYLPLSGGTVSGNTIFTSGLTANTLSVGNINNVDYINFKTSPTVPSPTGGTLFFDSSTNSLAYKPITNNNDVTINIGQESLIEFYNGTGIQINNGQALNITGSSGGYPSVALAIASGGNNQFYQVDGVATHDVPSGQIGFMTVFGVVRDINLTAFSPGEDIFLSQTTAGAFQSFSGLSFTGRTVQIGHVNDNSSLGSIQINIFNENELGLVTAKENNILTADNASTGIFEFSGITKTSNTTFSISSAKGWIVNNTTTPTNPTLNYISYSGATNIDSPYRTTNTITYILLTSASTLTLQPTPPTPKQRRENIYLGKIGHPDKANFSIAFQLTDYTLSPASQLRDMFIPLPLINNGVYPYSSGTGLSLGLTAGDVYGLGISFPTNTLDPNRLSVSGTSLASFQYRTQTGGTLTATTSVDPLYYDNAGIRTLIGTPAKQATNQRIFLLQDGSLRIQYGQTVYGDLTTALAAVQTEAFTTFPNFRDNGILLAILSLRSDTTNLSDSNYARILPVSKFGETIGAAGGLSVTTLQGAYNNSSEPEIVINSTLDGLTIKNGTGNADSITNLIQGQNASGVKTSFINADGGISGTSVSALTITTPSVTANANGLTASTISATTYYNLPIKYYAEFSASPTTSPIVLGTDSISIGNGAESRSTFMLAFGTNAAKGATGTTVSNFIGSGAGYGASGSTYSNFIGPNSGYGAINASSSNFIGNSTAAFSTGATQTNFFGVSSGDNSKDLNYSNVFGYQAGKSVTNAQYVNYFGHQAGNGATNATLSNFIGFSAGLFATNAQNSNFIGSYAGSQATGASFSTLIGYGAGKLFTGNNIGSNNIIIGTNLSLPNGTANGLNIGGVLFGTGFYSNTGTDPLIVPAGGKIGINVVSPSTTLHVGGDLTVTGFTSSASFTGISNTMSGTKGSVISNGSTSTAFIVFSGSNTVGGTGYTDFIRVTNTAAGAINPNKTLRVNNTGALEVINSVYTATTLSITDNGILYVGGGNNATSSSNDATSNYLSFNNNNSQIYDDGNMHIHSRGANQAMWINTNGGQIILGAQSPTSTGGIASAISFATTTVNGYVTINTGRTVTTASSYGYLTTGGAGTYGGGSQSVVISLYANNRIWGQEIDAFSDERMKDIQGEIKLEDGIKLVNTLKPIKYTWKNSDDKGIKAGYSAQQVIKSGFDHLIGLIPTEGLEERIDDDGFVSPKDTQFAMNYDQVTPYHGVVIKHLLEKIDELQKQINELKGK